MSLLQWQELDKRRRDAEAERDRYQDALREIASPRTGHLRSSALREIARTALGPTKAEGGS